MKYNIQNKPSNQTRYKQVSKMTRDENLILLGTAEIMMDYEKKLDEIRAKSPNCIPVRGLDAFQAYLSQYHYSAKDFIDMFPWSRSTFDRTALAEMPFIYVNQTARKLFKDQFDSFPPYIKRASKLYSAEDLNSYLRSHLSSSIETVVLPASMFIEDITAFREAFQEEKKSWLSKKMSGTKKIKPANYWDCMQHFLPDNVLAQALRWRDDLEFYLKEQRRSSVDRVTLPRYPVHLPEKILPIFLSPKGVAERNACTSASWGSQMIRKRGWVRHELTTPLGSVFGYTPGPLLGSPKHWDDYRLGASLIMLASRAEKLVGASAIQNAKHWNIPGDLIFKKWDSFRADAWQPMTDMDFLNSIR